MLPPMRIAAFFACTEVTWGDPRCPDIVNAGMSMIETEMPAEVGVPLFYMLVRDGSDKSEVQKLTLIIERNGEEIGRKPIEIQFRDDQAIYPMICVAGAEVHRDSSFSFELHGPGKIRAKWPVRVRRNPLRNTESTRPEDSAPPVEPSAS